MKSLAVLLICLLTLFSRAGGNSSVPTLLVPCYDKSQASQILAAAKRGHIAVILNVDSGPGAKLDKSWRTLAGNFRKAGAETRGYIDLVSWSKDGKRSTPRSAKAVALDAACWEDWYGVTAYFYDDWQKGTTRALVNPQGSIANPGTETATTCGTTLVWEATGYLQARPSKLPRVAIYAMGETDFRPALVKATREGAAYFYSVSAPDNWDAYNQLPKYFDALAAACRK